MKKILSAIVAAVMLFSVFATAVFAAPAEKIAISATSASGDRGTEISVTLKLDNTSAGLGGATVSLSWDSAVLEYVSHTAPTVSGLMSTVTKTGATSVQWTYLYTMSTTENFTADADITTVKFRVLNNAAYGYSPVTVSVIELYRNNNGTDILASGTDYTVTNGQIAIACASHEENTNIPREWKNGKEPTCASGATALLTCKKCTVKYELAVAALAHGTVTHHPKNSVSCAEGGNIEYWTCSKEPGVYYTSYKNGVLSGKVDKVTEDALNHKNAKKVAVKAATCTEDGVKEHYSCPDCGIKFKDAACTQWADDAWLKISATNHKNAVKVPKKDADCTNDGNNEYFSCADCGKAYKDAEFKTETTAENEVIKALGHNIEWSTTKEATETENGEKTGSCKNSGCTLPAQTVATGKIVQKLPADNISGDDKAALEGVGDQKLNEDVYFELDDVTDVEASNKENKNKIAEVIGSTADKTEIISIINGNISEKYFDNDNKLISSDEFEFDGKLKATLTLPKDARDYKDVKLVGFSKDDNKFVVLNYTDNKDGTISVEIDDAMLTLYFVGIPTVDGNSLTGIVLPIAITLAVLLIVLIIVVIIIKKKKRA